MEDVFEEWNTYARKKTLRPRDIDLNMIESISHLKIVGITGIRRSGKSSVLMLLCQKLMNENKRVSYVNLEDSRIKGSKTVLDDVLKWFGGEGYLLLDEIADVYDWQGWLAKNHELLKGELFLITSSSRRKLAVPSKPLRGRILVYEIWPLSFKEFLRFKDIKIEHTTVGIGRLEKALSEYLVYGGFPEVVLLGNKTDKIHVLNSYFKDIIGLDIAEMSEESITTVELFGKYVIETSYFSASKCLNFFKSLGHRIGKQSILNLEKHSQDGYLFFFVPIFSYTIKNRLQYPRKAYLGDTGFMYAMTGKTDVGRLFENAVFLELRRRVLPQQNIYYWKDRGGYECDFVICEGLKPKEIIQVVYNMDDKKTKEREIRGLIRCMREFGLKEGIIITKDSESIEKIDGLRIRFVLLKKWLLGL